jgi:hypothetical protein
MDGVEGKAKVKSQKSKVKSASGREVYASVILLAGQRFWVGNATRA